MKSHNFAPHGYALTDGSVDALASLVGAEAAFLVPSQFADERRKADPFFAERRLWLAVFQDAIDRWTMVRTPAALVAAWDGSLVPNEPGRRIRERAELLDWLTDDSEAILSFRWYCDVLNLDASATRAALFSGRAVLIPRDNSRDPQTQIRPARRHERRVA